MCGRVGLWCVTVSLHLLLLGGEFSVSIQHTVNVGIE